MSEAVILPFVIFIIIQLSTSADVEILHLEELVDKTCSETYKQALGNGTEIDFTQPIGGLSCPTGTFYHCVPLSDFDRSKQIQFCSKWIWIEKGRFK